MSKNNSFGRFDPRRCHCIASKRRRPITQWRINVYQKNKILGWFAARTFRLYFIKTRFYSWTMCAIFTSFLKLLIDTVLCTVLIVVRTGNRYRVFCLQFVLATDTGWFAYSLYWQQIQGVLCVDLHSTTYSAYSLYWQKIQDVFCVDWHSTTYGAYSLYWQQIQGVLCVDLHSTTYSAYSLYWQKIQGVFFVDWHSTTYGAYILYWQQIQGVLCVDLHSTTYSAYSLYWQKIQDVFCVDWHSTTYGAYILYWQQIQCVLCVDLHSTTYSAYSLYWQKIQDVFYVDLHSTMYSAYSLYWQLMQSVFWTALPRNELLRYRSAEQSALPAERRLLWKTVRPHLCACVCKLETGSAAALLIPWNRPNFTSLYSHCSHNCLSRNIL